MNILTPMWAGSFAKKVKPVYVKPVKEVIKLEEGSMLWEKIFLNTIEGAGVVDMSRLLAIGEHGDVWMIEFKTFNEKYDIESIDQNGWAKGVPKHDQPLTEFIQVPLDAEPGFIEGLWGATVNGVKNLQAFKPGDYICRSSHNTVDQWVVAKAIFENTYVRLG